MTRLASILARFDSADRWVIGCALAGMVVGACGLVFAAERGAPKQVRHYPFTCISNHDGDTLTGDAYLGLGVSRRVTVRVLDIDAYELRDKPRGPDAKAFTASWLASAKGLEIVTDDDGVDSFGRILARVYDQRGRSLGADLLKAGHAEEYKR